MKIPYRLTAAVKTEVRHQNMLEAIKRGLPRLEAAPFDDSKTLHIACYGPSLQDTWQQLGRPILSMSGATKFLAERGIIPDYHCAMDPREEQLDLYRPPVPGVHYLMASVCHPGVWDLLQDQRVTLFHVISDHGLTMEFTARHDPGALVFNGGSTIGLTALHLGGAMGYRRFEIHGMDGSFDGTARHAGEHPERKKQSDDITWDAGCVTYRTSKVMANAVAETLNQIRNFAMLCIFHGAGLTQALVREAGLDNACCADETEKADRIRRARVQVIPLGTNEKVRPSSPFEALVQYPPETWQFDLELLASVADARRDQARYNTGSISVGAMLFLRAIVEVVKPKVIVEVGTFIGASTSAMAHGLAPGGHIYTCDKDNDCLPSDESVTCFPMQTSTEMLTELVDKGVKADLFFFDGRIQPPDLPLILRLSTPRTVYCFDDYLGQEKGVVNVGLLGPLLPQHGLMLPPTNPGSEVTIATLGPRL